MNKNSTISDNYITSSPDINLSYAGIEAEGVIFVSYTEVLQQQDNFYLLLRSITTRFDKALRKLAD